MLALRGLFARKGIPNMIISDNFKAFKVQMKFESSEVSNLH